MNRLPSNIVEMVWDCADGTDPMMDFELMIAVHEASQSGIELDKIHSLVRDTNTENVKDRIVRIKRLSCLRLCT